jgi:lipoprotein-anchoring transpeptidase ErfK/SrfK
MVRPSLVIAVVVLAGLLASAAFAVSRARRHEAPSARPVTRQVGGGPKLQPLPAIRPAGPPRPVAAKPPAGHEVLRVRAGRSVALHSKPGGRVVTTVAATTQFGSPSTLAVAAQHGGWLGVTSTNLPNGKLAWVKASHGLFDQHRTRIAIRVDLSRRRLRLFDGRRLLRTVTVGVGRPGSPTPTGRYAITDKLAGSAYGPYYGCCILALSGHQTNTPAGWRGGDRLAIHGTDDPSSIGVPSSAGCLHADAEDLKLLMRRVPLGTPVFIHA